MREVPSILNRKSLWCRRDWGDWVTPKLLSKEPVYRWFVFPHSFSGEIVEFFVRKWKLDHRHTILDPFVGAGTTLVAAKSCGINGLGIDISPLAVLISNVKVRNYDDELPLSWRRLRRSLKRLESKQLYADSEFSRRAFSEKPFSLLQQVRDLVRSIPNVSHREFFMLGLLGILSGVSRAKRSGGWLRWQHHGATATSIVPRFVAQVESMLEDVRAASGSSSLGNCEARLGDARNFSSREKFDAAITSPPYPNRHDYSRIFNVELAFAFLDDAAITKLRWESFRSHVEARPPQYDVRDYAEVPELENLIAKLEKRATDRRIARMLRGYFQDVYLTLRSARTALKPRAPMALIVGNVRYHGLTIPVDTVVARIAARLGFEFERILVARYRGNSAQQMGEYGRLPSRESVVLLRNSSSGVCL